LKQVVNKENALFCPMIDARRMEIYTAFFNPDGTLYREVSADVISEQSYAEILENHPVYFFGNGSDKCKPILTHKNALFIGEIVPLAENMIDLAIKSFQENRFENVAYFEPFYLKEFQTTVPKIKV
jgi:tRNA threonylcarbamoyladenosine biosynthesis protein TsaB